MKISIVYIDGDEPNTFRLETEVVNKAFIIGIQANFRAEMLCLLVPI